MNILLAPMEGVVDHIMRELLCRIGGIDTCVTEFLRVTDHCYPDKVFYQRCPELSNNGYTSSNVLVRLQLLGGKPEPIAENAARAVELGAKAIDLNFGCPAKTVNKNDGGACLLQDPDRVETIVAATRKHVPNHIPVTAKIRLGFNDRSLYLENAQAAESGGANALTVHARSKVDGYKPPAYWEYITRIREALKIPVTANGEIWSLADFERCREVTGCDSYMLGRGLLACPDLANQIKTACQHQKDSDNYSAVSKNVMSWPALCKHLQCFFDDTVSSYPAKYTGNRLKQWLHYLSRQYPEAVTLFEEIKRLRDAEAISEAIQNSKSMSHKKSAPLEIA
jgi:tRNA-dihydrouridine synthase C